MRHQKHGRRLGRTSAHRQALFRNLVTALIENGRLRTTDAKAKELRGAADRIITLAKQGTLHARRRAFDKLRNRSAVQKLFEEIAPTFEGRAGGYTRIIKLGIRPGDAASMSLIEWTATDEKKRPAKKSPQKDKEAAAS